MKEYFVPYQPSLDMRDMGYNEYFNGWYYRLDGRLFKSDYEFDFDDARECIAPLYQQALKWFREKHNMLATVYSNASGFLFEWHDTNGGTSRGSSEHDGPNDSGCWDTYEEAQLACIMRLIKAIKNPKP